MASPALTAFLNSTAGAQWMAITVDEWEQKLLQAGNRSLQDLDKRREQLLAGLQTVDASSLESLQTSALSVPLLVTEAYLKERLYGLWRHYGRRYLLGCFAWRIAAAGLLVEGVKAGLRWACRRRPRLRRTVAFILDTALPTAYCGPVLGIWSGVLAILAHRPPPSLAPLLEGTGAAGGAPEQQPPLTTGAEEGPVKAPGAGTMPPET